MQTSCEPIPLKKLIETLEIYLDALGDVESGSEDIKNLKSILHCSWHYLSIYSDSVDSLEHIRDALTAMYWRIHERDAKVQ